MATLPDVILTGTAYQNVYAATAITVGTAVTVQNKGSNPVLLQNLATQPSSSSPNGFVLLANESIDVTGTVLGLWAKGTGPISVEVIT